MLPLPFPASTISLNYGDTKKPYSSSSPHNGIDFSSHSQGVVAGATIRASGPGVVVRSGWEKGTASPTMGRPNKNAGNSIDVLYPDEHVIVRYMHRPADSPSPAVGTPVSEGTTLGVVGATGYVTAPHLHMETWDTRTGRRVSPWTYFARAQTAASTAKPFTPPPEPEEDMRIYTCTNGDIKLAVPGVGTVRIQNPGHVQLLQRLIANTKTGEGREQFNPEEDRIISAYLRGKQP